MIAKGTVKGNIVVLDEGESLPDGARVEIGVIEMKLPLEERRKTRGNFQPHPFAPNQPICRHERTVTRGTTRIRGAL